MAEATYKAITIHQPYARLIVTGKKLIENRTWPTRYRGPLLIHAGKSKQWLDHDEADDYAREGDPLEFGAIVGAVHICDCRPVELVCGNGRHDAGCPGLPRHDHLFGPWCWILADVERFARPIPYKGAQGLFGVPASVMREAA